VELHRSALPHARRVDASRAHDPIAQGLVSQTGQSEFRAVGSGLSRV
jgi:hypothetical protein